MRRLLKLSIPAIAGSLLIAACGSSSSGSTTTSAASTQGGGGSSNVVVKTGSSSLGTILVDSRGMTLYHLGGEQNGKFICTGSACLGEWHPLIATSSAAPSGAVGSLGTVKRPEGTVQVTYKGTPLYTFADDKQPGETNGQGFKDVGTWTVITTGSGGTSTGSGGTSSGSGGTSTGTASPSEPEGSSEGSSGGGAYKY